MSSDRIGEASPFRRWAGAFEDVIAAADNPACAVQVIGDLHRIALELPDLAAPDVYEDDVGGSITAGFRDLGKLAFFLYWDKGEGCFESACSIPAEEYEKEDAGGTLVFPRFLSAAIDAMRAALGQPQGVRGVTS